MTQVAFSKPFVFMWPGTHSPRVVRSLAAASDFLFDNWDKYDSGTWTDALRDCQDAAVGICSLNQADEAFAMALREAGFSIQQH